MTNDVTRTGRGLPPGRKPKRWFGIKPEFVISAAVVISTAMMITAVFFFDFLRNLGRPDSTFMIVGELRVTGSNLNFGSHTGECAGAGGYSDLREGAAVAVANSSGRTIAIGRLGAGKSTTSGGSNGSVARLAACTFPIKVEGVPDGEDFYAVTVTHRGAQQYSREQLKQPIVLTLG